MSRLIFLRPNGGNLVLSEMSHSTIQKYLQHEMSAAEAGGVLLGRLILNSNDVIIDDVTIPSKVDKRNRFFFWRSRKTAQEQVNEAWKESYQTRVYLGEWHTHPEDDPSPSCVDKKNWRRIVRNARYEQESLFFIIAGRKTIRIWEQLKIDNEPILLRENHLLI